MTLACVSVSHETKREYPVASPIELTNSRLPSYRLLLYSCLNELKEKALSRARPATNCWTAPISVRAPRQHSGGEPPLAGAELSFPRAWRTQSSRDTVGGVRAQALQSGATLPDVSSTPFVCSLEASRAF